MRVSRVSLNVRMAVGQVVVSAVLLFGLYYFLLRTLGAELLGVWSILIVTASAARLSEFGMSGSVTKFVAKYLAGAEQDRAAQVVGTALLFVIVLLSVLLVPAYFLLLPFLDQIFPASVRPVAQSVLPIVLFSIWVSSIGAVFLAALDGVQRTDLRSIVMICGLCLNLVGVISLAPTYGLAGVAIAQVVQAASIMVAAFLCLKSEFGIHRIRVCCWNKRLFTEMFGYGLNVQFSSLLQLLFDPLTKILLNAFVGLSIVGYYEMVSRLIMQCRMIIVSANQVAVPIVAESVEIRHENVDKIYVVSFDLVLFLAIPLFGSVVAMLPVISELWIGHREDSFIAMGMILAVGRLINTLSGPAYFGNMGIGVLKWNTISHVVVGMLNVLFGSVLGFWFGGNGVVAGASIALTVGGVLLIAQYHRTHELRISTFVRWDMAILSLMSIALPMLTHLTYSIVRPKFGLASTTAISMTLVIALISPLLWTNRLRPQLVAWILTRKDPEIQ